VGNEVSPSIIHLSWGRMEVTGVGVGKDFKLYPGGGREWDWSETGTRHSPGIQPADVAELIEHRCDAIVLSCGMERRLQVMPETISSLEELGIRVYVEETKKAVDVYNGLAGNARVGGLFHSTC
jgi:hypothetical protein